MKCSKVVNKSFGVGRPNTMGLASVLIFGMLSFPVVAESDDDDGAASPAEREHSPSFGARL